MRLFMNSNIICNTAHTNSTLLSDIQFSNNVCLCSMILVDQKICPTLKCCSQVLLAFKKVQEGLLHY